MAKSKNEHKNEKNEPKSEPRAELSPEAKAELEEKPENEPFNQIHTQETWAQAEEAQGKLAGTSQPLPASIHPDTEKQKEQARESEGKIDTKPVAHHLESDTDDHADVGQTVSLAEPQRTDKEQMSKPDQPQPEGQNPTHQPEQPAETDPSKPQQREQMPGQQQPGRHQVDPTAPMPHREPGEPPPQPGDEPPQQPEKKSEERERLVPRHTEAERKAAPEQPRPDPDYATTAQPGVQHQGGGIGGFPGPSYEQTEHFDNHERARRLVAAAAQLRDNIDRPVPATREEMLLHADSMIVAAQALDPQVIVPREYDAVVR